MKNGKFWKYLRTKVSAADYDNLAVLLGCSAHRLTKLQNGNQDFTIEEIEKVAALVSANPVTLASLYRLGYSTNTITEIEAFAKRHDYQPTLVFQAFQAA